MSAIDLFGKFTDPSADLILAPALNAFSITPSDNNETGNVTRGLYIGTGGNITLVPAGHSAGAAITLKNIPDGCILPVRVKQVKATGTTCADIIGLY